MKYKGFKTNSKDEAKAAVAYLVALGFIDDTDQWKANRSVIWIDNFKKINSADNGSMVALDVARASFSDYLKINPEVSQPLIKLNDDYSAVVTLEGVKVGCQTFTHEAVLAVAKAIEQFNK
jgi:hypothetical protein